MAQVKPASYKPEFLWKRPVDVFLASLLLILFSPLIALLAVLVKLTSPGPIFHRSSRIGRGGKCFTFWKFRSMFYGTKRDEILARNEHHGPIFKIRKDPRITPLGRYIRRYSLDELPQLVNVLRGDMSIVGPRPLPAEDLDRDDLEPEFKYWASERTRVRPGITGLWQTRGRSNISFEKMVELDMEYVRNRSAGLDMRILLETPVVMCSGRGAY